MNANERVNHPMPARELERRWAELRRNMKARKIDALLMQGNNDFMGGYVKYLTDFPTTNGYPVTVIFHHDEGMAVVAQGAFGTDRRTEDPLRPGVTRFLGTPSYASAAYTLQYETELALDALRRHADGVIGLVGPGTLPYSMIDGLKQNMPNARFVDASSMVDAVKVRKSPDELVFIRRAASMQDRAMHAVLGQIRPGLTENQIGALAEKACRDLGSEQGLYLCASSPIGQPSMKMNRHFQNRVLRDGDVFHLLIESSGPGGYYTELGRTFVLGEATPAMREEFDFARKARDFTLSLIRAGKSCAQIWSDYNDYMKANGRPEEKRLFCHGQGYDMVERPLVRFDEEAPILPGTLLACHPTFRAPDSVAWICDNYFIGEDLSAERLHQFPEVLIEI